MAEKGIFRELAGVAIRLLGHNSAAFLPRLDLGGSGEEVEARSTTTFQGAPR
jgi:hypothetical protein